MAWLVLATASVDYTTVTALAIASVGLGVASAWVAGSAAGELRLPVAPGLAVAVLALRRSFWRSPG